MDWERIEALLSIVEKSVGHPQLKNITNAALAELAKHNEGPAPAEPAPVPRRKATEE